METTTGLPVFFLKSRMLWCISSLAVTPPPGELTSSTTARRWGPAPAWRRASASPSGVAVGCVPPRVSSAGGDRTLDGHDGYLVRSVAGHVLLVVDGRGRRAARGDQDQDHREHGEADQSERHEPPTTKGHRAPSPRFSLHASRAAETARQKKYPYCSLRRSVCSLGRGPIERGCPRRSPRRL